jgi:LCP family protein required for cell wall assembly
MGNLDIKRKTKSNTDLRGFQSTNDFNKTKSLRFSDTGFIRIQEQKSVSADYFSKVLNQELAVPEMIEVTAIEETISNGQQYSDVPVYTEQAVYQEEFTNVLKAKTHKNWHFRKAYILFPFITVVLIIGIFLGSRYAWFAGSISSADNTSAASVSNNVGAVLGESIPALKVLDQSNLADAIRQNRRINILMLGYGGSGHSGGYLTDSIMVLSLDFATNKVTMISVPRDLWVEVPTDGNDGSYWKINAAYELGLDQKDYPNKLPQFTGSNGGGNEAKDVISQVLGISIDYYISVDFDGFKQVVDSVGGVDINVPDAFTDYSYPNGDQNTSGEDCNATVLSAADQAGCRYLTLHFDAGLQHMDGDRALEYSRSRHASGSEGSDFARSRRQQQIITAVEEKALQLGSIDKISNLLNAIQGHVYTDLSLAEIKDLGDYLTKQVNLDQANHGQLTDAANSLLYSTYSDDKQWILLPNAGKDDYTQIHEYIYDLLNDITYQKAPTQTVSAQSK